MTRRSKNFRRIASRWKTRISSQRKSTHKEFAPRRPRPPPPTKMALGRCRHAVLLRASGRASSTSPGRGATAPSSARATAPEGLRRAPLCRPAPWSSNPSRTSTPPGSGPAERPASTGGPIAPPQSDRPHLSGRFWRHAFLPRPSKSTAKARMKIAAASKTMLSGSMSLPCNTISRASAVMAMKIG